MDSKRLIIFVVLSTIIFVGWQKFVYLPAHPPVKQTQGSQAPSSTKLNGSSESLPNTTEPSASPDAAKLISKERISVATDLFNAEIDTQGGDLRDLALLKHDSASDAKKPFLLFSDKDGHTYIAQSGLLSDNVSGLATHKTIFSAEKKAYKLSGDSLEVRLTAPEESGVKVSKIYVFHKNSYQINLRYEISNGSGNPLNLNAYYRFLRDGKSPEGESRFARTFTGPALFTDDGKLKKVSFSDLDKGKAEYPQHASSGWISIIQHYFVSAWLLKPNNQASVCANAQDCTFSIRAQDNGLYSAGVIVKLKQLANGEKASYNMDLYAGPQEYSRISKIANGLDRVKDYGWVRIFATPLFWWLTVLFSFVKNWGWAIILLTLSVKALLYPLTAASYRSMAKMRAVAPQLERLKKEYGDDRMKLQQATMAMYKTEKINPLGGCLPMLVQVPIFLGLYWALLASVELRQAPWILWIHDLARPDPYYLLPALMAVAMFIQTYLNPPPSDPIQAKMMKIMPIAFSVMFFFFPAGLVLYWLVNNLLSMTQQWYINRTIKLAREQKAVH